MQMKSNQFGVGAEPYGEEALTVTEQTNGLK